MITKQMTVLDLKMWLATLPPEADKAKLTSCVHGMPSTVKRVLIRQYKGEEDAVFCFQSMGTHFYHDFLECSEDIVTPLT